MPPSEGTPTTWGQRSFSPGDEAAEAAEEAEQDAEPRTKEAAREGTGAGGDVSMMTGRPTARASPIASIAVPQVTGPMSALS